MPPKAQHQKVDTQTGALSYTYPLAVPPGRDGATPAVSLQYSSNSLDNSNVFGYGWSVSIPSISRVNKNGTNNLYATSSVFTSSLDGELVQVGSTTAYVPRTENGDFRKYTFSNNSWTVAEKDGTVMTFGSSTSARRDDPNDSSHVFAWELEQSRDANDDYIQYQYYKDAGTDLSGYHYLYEPRQFNGRHLSYQLLARDQGGTTYCRQRRGSSRPPPIA